MLLLQPLIELITLKWPQLKWPTDRHNQVPNWVQNMAKTELYKWISEKKTSPIASFALFHFNLYSLCVPKESKPSSSIPEIKVGKESTQLINWIIIETLKFQDKTHCLLWHNSVTGKSTTPVQRLQMHRKESSKLLGSRKILPIRTLDGYSIVFLGSNAFTRETKQMLSL